MYNETGGGGVGAKNIHIKDNSTLKFNYFNSFIFEQKRQLF